MCSLMRSSTHDRARSDVLTRDVGAGSHDGGMRSASGPPSDASAGLRARIPQGDREAFVRFYDAFAGLALGLIRRILRDPEAFWQICQEAGRYDPHRAVSSARGP
jgi:hypothetical protein